MWLKLTLICSIIVPAVNQPVAVLKEASWPFTTGPADTFVVRSVKELVEASPQRTRSEQPEVQQRVMDEVTKALKVKDIDWKTQMLLVIRLKQIHPRGIIVGPIVNHNRSEIAVNYTYWRPVEAREGDIPPTPTDVATMVLVHRYDTKVKFTGSERTPK